MICIVFESVKSDICTSLIITLKPNFKAIDWLMLAAKVKLFEFAPICVGQIRTRCQNSFKWNFRLDPRMAKFEQIKKKKNHTV
ncbi:hypothetical protein NQ315_004970 [Exocentrus adspersus]|uniref:Uncharacterized protein n=1 Tax=Exocentrus adspersus TaxID=1586481 RepID=A0AAV8V876_9CUCU|nr:hypothetical protein NQ315_004970 [Exocentrus adspersus]